jgi:hypothetical protein
MTTRPSSARGERDGASSVVSLALAWLAVGLPLVWGVWQTIGKSMALFR